MLKFIRSYFRQNRVFFEPVALLIFLAITAVAILAQPDRPTNLVVLLDDLSGKTGEVTVTSAGKSVLLDKSGLATGVSAKGDAPRRSFVIGKDEIESLFGKTIGARPDLPRDYRLYFRSGSAELDENASSVVNEIVADVAKRRNAELYIIGHADSTGRPEVNVRISLRRARVVEQVLREKFSDIKIYVDSHGDRIPVVPTPRGVAEPKNRRVEVTVR